MVPLFKTSIVEEDNAFRANLTAEGHLRDGVIVYRDSCVFPSVLQAWCWLQEMQQNLRLVRLRKDDSSAR